MVIVSRQTQSLSDDTIDKLIDTTITKHDKSEKLVKNIKQEEMLEKMSKNLQLIKEQNDEIIGDEFE